MIKIEEICDRCGDEYETDSPERTTCHVELQVEGYEPISCDLCPQCREALFDLLLNEPALPNVEPEDGDEAEVRPDDVDPDSPVGLAKQEELDREKYGELRSAVAGHFQGRESVAMGELCAFCQEKEIRHSNLARAMGIDPKTFANCKQAARIYPYVEQAARQYFGIHLIADPEDGAAGSAGAADSTGKDA